VSTCQRVNVQSQNCKLNTKIMIY